ncbi:hypothetical protein OZN62_11210 [Aurantiacibacter sp. MUD11]|uniref:hypothetical protein n=1 Tax=Aurantiacibacter sp. MUD11 TaxID=3003265 RepID=UPI0022AA19D5|nr:hypothetical protein [Aurantiacibacter sp. MUD11]WAT17482.1 hypothetical protein OZN62_11210 [Aurantiacibacter sp. MUD11]
MADSTHQSDAILEAAGRSLQMNREGGYHRRGGFQAQGSKRIKRNHLTKKLVQLAMGIVGVFVAMGVAGAILNGIGFWGVMISAVAIALLATIILKQKVKLPQRHDLVQTTDAKQLVARTELWLESQRPALPPPAVSLVDQIGVQLDGLGQQLEHVDPAHPAAAETRKLVGEHLPEMIDSYCKIPRHLRGEERAGATPDAQLVDSLGKISKEIDSVTRQLAEGSLDDLAIRNRYLDYKYGNTQLPAPGENA